MVRSLDNNRVGGWDIDTGFDNGRADQNVKTLMVEVVHHAFQFAFAHLPVTNGNPRFRHQLRQPFGGFLDVFHIVIEIVNLATAQHFTQNRLTYHQIVVFTNKGFDCQTARRWRGDDRQIAHAAHRHVQRTRDRRGGKRQNIHIGTHRFDTLFMTHAETVLFIDDQQSQIFQLHITLQQFVRADQNINFPFGNLFQDLRLLFGATEAGKHLDAHWPVSKAVAEVIKVLLSKQRCRHQHRYLFVVFDREERSAHRHFGFAKSDVTAYQTVHRQRLAHIAEHGVNRLRLVGGRFEREAVAEQLVLFAIVFEGEPLFCCTLGVDIQQFGCHIAHFLRRFLPGA